jgi:hypothetical protein
VKSGGDKVSRHMSALGGLGGSLHSESVARGQTARRKGRERKAADNGEKVGRNTRDTRGRHNERKKAVDLWKKHIKTS